jgi:TrmH family RNA methyltransferase
VRRLGRLVSHRRDRYEEGVFVVEGLDLVEAALDNGATIESIYVGPDGRNADIDRVLARSYDLGIDVVELTSPALVAATDVATPQPLLATVAMQHTPLSAVPIEGTYIAVHELRDPGNLGTIIRSAHATGASGVILTGDCVDPFSPKTVRATTGSLFAVPVIVSTLEQLLELANSHTVTINATVVAGGEDPRTSDLTGAQILVVGSESHGLPPEFCAAANRRLTIPMPGQSESLNAAVAASLFLFEAMYQRHRGENA